jgi:hypothetical protein
MRLVRRLELEQEVAPRRAVAAIDQVGGDRRDAVPLQHLADRAVAAGRLPHALVELVPPARDQRLDQRRRRRIEVLLGALEAARAAEPARALGRQRVVWPAVK